MEAWYPPETMFFLLFSLARLADGAQNKRELKRAPFLGRPLFFWLINILLPPLDTNSIKTGAVLFLFALCQSFWHRLLGSFLCTNPSVLPPWHQTHCFSLAQALCTRLFFRALTWHLSYLFVPDLCFSATYQRPQPYTSCEEMLAP